MVAKACQVEFEGIPIGIPIGILAYTDDTPFGSFEYSSDWIAHGFSIAPLHMPLSKQVYRFNALSEETFKGLPAVFADSLPDKNTAFFVDDDYNWRLAPAYDIAYSYKPDSF